MIKIYILYLFIILFIIPTLFLFENKNYQEDFANKKCKRRPKRTEDRSSERVVKNRDEWTPEDEKKTRTRRYTTATEECEEQVDIFRRVTGSNNPNDKKNEKTFSMVSEVENGYSLNIDNTNKLNIFIASRGNNAGSGSASGSGSSSGCDAPCTFFYSEPDKKLGEKFSVKQVDNKNYEFQYLNTTFKLNFGTKEKPLTVVVNNFEKTYEIMRANSGNQIRGIREVLFYNIIFYNQAIGNVQVNKKNGKISEIFLTTVNQDIIQNNSYQTAIYLGLILFDNSNNLTPSNNSIFNES